MRQLFEAAPHLFCVVTVGRTGGQSRSHARTERADSRRACSTSGSSRPPLHALQRIRVVMHLLKNLNASSPPSDLVTLCRKPAAPAPWLMSFSTNFSCPSFNGIFSDLFSVVQQLFPSIQIPISSGVQSRALSKSFASVSRTHHCSFGFNPS